MNETTICPNCQHDQFDEDGDCAKCREPEVVEADVALTKAESATLEECETVIQRGLNIFWEVGQALMCIRDEKLYRATHKRFEDYCRERWGFTASRARQLIAATKTVDRLGSVTNVTPANESQARELAKVPEKEQSEVWHRVVESTDGKPTAAAIREHAGHHDAAIHHDDEHAEHHDDDEPQPNGKVRGRGIELADEAISCLKQIPKNDALRKRGFQIVTDWIEFNR